MNNFIIFMMKSDVRYIYMYSNMKGSKYRMFYIMKVREISEDFVLAF
jgi:hypothetical protein